MKYKYQFLSKRKIEHCHQNSENSRAVASVHPSDGFCRVMMLLTTDGRTKRQGISPTTFSFIDFTCTAIKITKTFSFDFLQLNYVMPCKQKAHFQFTKPFQRNWTLLTGLYCNQSVGLAATKCPSVLSPSVICVV